MLQFQKPARFNAYSLARSRIRQFGCAEKPVFFEKTGF